MFVRLTTLKVGVSLSGLGTGQAPELSVPAHHGAVLTLAVLFQVRPHAEQVQLHLAKRSSRRPVPRPAAQPQGAGGRNGLSDDRPLRHRLPINLKRLTNLKTLLIKGLNF